MKICFMGTPDFASNILEKIILSKHEVVAVITQPDKPKGRGKKMLFSPVKEIALKHNIKVFQPIKIKKDTECLDEIKNLNADIFVVAAYGQILSKEILDMPKYGCINVHGSLLPKYRGAAPIQWSIINGEEKTGITIMKMDVGLDTGDMILKKELKIEKNDTSQILYLKLSNIGADATLEALDKIENKTAIYEKQDDNLATYAPMLKKEMGLIDWNKSSKEILNLIRGLQPWPLCYTVLNDNTILKILLGEEYLVEKINATSGQILIANSKIGIVIKTGDGAILLKSIKTPSGKIMNSADYLKGHTIEENQILR